MFEHEQLNIYVDCKIVSYSQTVSFLPGVSKYPVWQSNYHKVQYMQQCANSHLELSIEPHQTTFHSQLLVVIVNKNWLTCIKVLGMGIKCHRLSATCRVAVPQTVLCQVLVLSSFLIPHWERLVREPIEEMVVTHTILQLERRIPLSNVAWSESLTPIHAKIYHTNTQIFDYWTDILKYDSTLSYFGIRISKSIVIYQLNEKITWTSWFDNILLANSCKQRSQNLHKCIS